MERRIKQYGCPPTVTPAMREGDTELEHLKRLLGWGSKQPTARATRGSRRLRELWISWFPARVENPWVLLDSTVE